MSQEDRGASQLDHPEEIFWVVFPANDSAAKIMKPGEQTLDFPAPSVATQNAAVLRGSCNANEFAGGGSEGHCAGSVGRADDMFDRTDSETAGRAKEHPCVAPKRLRSVPHACLATVALAHRLVVWDETTVREPPIGRR